MSVCDYCGDSFSTGGVSQVGVGTFCSHKCKVLKIHKSAGLPTKLHYFTCRFCKSVLVTSGKSSQPERCICSGSWLTYSHSVEVTTKEEQELFAKGRVWNPHRPKPEPWVCVRCGEVQTGVPEIRADGLACYRCYRAEEHPPIPPLLTAEEIEQRKRERKALRDEIEDRHERANQLKEQEHR